MNMISQGRQVPYLKQITVYQKPKIKLFKIPMQSYHLREFQLATINMIIFNSHFVSNI